MKKKTIEIPIYYGYFTMVNSKGWDKVCKKYKIDISDEFEAIVFKNNRKDGHTEYVAAFNGKTTGKVIAHETVHLVNHVFNDRKMDLDIFNDEPQAYLTGWFFEQIEKFFK